MSQQQCTTCDNKNKYITEIERYKIEIYLEEGNNVKEIAKKIGKHIRTINREIKRGTVELLDTHLKPYDKYCADVSQRKYIENSRNKGPNIKLGCNHKFAKFIEEIIKNEKFSPYAALEKAKQEKDINVNICLKTLYNYIDMDLFLGISNKDLPVKKNGKIRKYKKTKVALNNKKGESI